MTDTNADAVEEEAPKASKLPLILGLVAALLGAGAGFFATFSGMILAPEVEDVVPEEEELEPLALADVAYVPIDPLIISIGAPTDRRHLRFRAQLEVPKKYKTDVETVMPRIVDVLNGYLRAVHIEDLEKSTALIKLRSHMFRRVEIVTGKGRVNDLLVMEFVLN